MQNDTIDATDRARRWNGCQELADEARSRLSMFEVLKRKVRNDQDIGESAMNFLVQYAEPSRQRDQRLVDDYDLLRSERTAEGPVRRRRMAIGESPQGKVPPSPPRP